VNLLEQIPGLRAAVAAEQFARDLAFAEVPEDVAGVAVGPLNWLRFTRLAVIGSPFICGGQVTPTNLKATLWLLAPNYNPASRWRRWRFLRRADKIPYLKLINALDEYFRESLMDSPTGKRSEGESPSYYSTIAAQVDLFANEYGWPAAEIIRLPFKQLWQLLRRIQARNGSEVFFNPSDKVRGAWLSAENSKRLGTN